MDEWEGYLCKNEKELRMRLEDYELTSEEIEEYISHERGHYNKAKELGYSPDYFFVPVSNGFRILTIVEDMDSEDVSTIASAPEKPSLIDKVMAFSYEEGLKK